MRRLKGGLPRRFSDHRSTVAHRYRGAFETIAERYPPTDRLGRELTGLAADLLVDYTALRQGKRGTATQRRKTAGLLIGALREVRRGATTNGRKPTSVADLVAARSRPS